MAPSAASNGGRSSNARRRGAGTMAGRPLSRHRLVGRHLARLPDVLISRRRCGLARAARALLGCWLTVAWLLPVLAACDGAEPGVRAGAPSGGHGEVAMSHHVGDPAAAHGAN